MIVTLADMENESLMLSMLIASSFATNNPQISYGPTLKNLFLTE